MDMSGFLALIHQLYPGIPVLVIVAAAIALVLLTFILRKQGGGQRISASMSVSAEPASSQPPHHSEPDKIPNPTPDSPVTLKVEANPTISPALSQSFSPSLNIRVEVPNAPQPQSATPERANPTFPAAPPEGFGISAPNSGSATGMPSSENTPTDRATVKSSEVEVGKPPVNPLIDSPSTQAMLDGSPRAEMHMHAAPADTEVPHAAPAVSPVDETATTEPTAAADSQTTDGGEQEEPHSSASLGELAAPASVTRASPSGRLASQQRSDARVALREISAITQKTYVFAKASQYISQAQWPFANEIHSLRVLRKYLEYVVPRLAVLNRSLDRLGITWDNRRNDPRWVMFACLNPFETSLVDPSPVVIRDAFVKGSQTIAEALDARGYRVKRDRAWGQGGAFLYRLEGIEITSTNPEDAELTDSDIEEADAEFEVEDELEP